ncbi:MAG: galactose mutarotase [Bacteroidales bacterium]|nr:galactose mutarotase [Bacteroidales bacterium]
MKRKTPGIKALMPAFMLLLSCMFIFCSCNKQQKPADSVIDNISKENFDTTLDGKAVSVYLLKNNGPLVVAITNYGARVVGIYVPDKNNNYINAALGFNSIAAYLESPDVYFGPVVGRVGNRIAKGRFTLDGTTYDLAINNGPNHLHGGIKGLHKVVWDVVESSANKLVLSYLSPDMEEGYPGNLNITVTYSIEDSNSMVIEYKAITDKPTPVNLTNHTYFNLNGKSNEPVNNHILKINADFFTPVDSTLIPFGTLEAVANTPFDFRQPKPVGNDLQTESTQLTYGGGYDHNWAINTTQSENGYYESAIVSSPLTGVQMEIFSQEPGLQFYGGNFFNGTITAGDGNKVGYRCGLALEPQHFPDAVNQPNFDPIILKPGEIYSTKSKYRFTTLP